MALLPRCVTLGRSACVRAQGIITLGINRIFDQILSEPQTRFLVKISYYEIYQEGTREDVVDLLSGEVRAWPGGACKRRVCIIGMAARCAAK